jgi:hypothetical protein
MSRSTLGFAVAVRQISGAGGSSPLYSRMKRLM